MAVLFYKTNKGDVIEDFKVKEAFRIISGRYDFEDESGYARFLYGLLGKIIVGVVNAETDPILKDGYLHAVKKYRDEHGGCDLREARSAVEAYRLALFDQ